MSVARYDIEYILGRLEWIWYSCKKKKFKSWLLQITKLHTKLYVCKYIYWQGYPQNMRVQRLLFLINYKPI